MQTTSISLESEAGFRVLFECATISIIVINENGRIELSNPCAEALFGYQPSELIGQPIEVLIPQSLRAKHSHHRENYFTKPKARPMGVGMELKALRKDGKEFPVEISLGYYTFMNELLAVAFVTDITQRKMDQETILAREAMLSLEESSLIFLNKASSELWKINSLEKGLKEILRASMALVKADKGNVQMLDNVKNVLTISVHEGFSQTFLDLFGEVSATDDSSCGRALRNKQQIVIDDTEEDALFAPFRAIARESGYRSVVSTPFFDSAGTAIGILSVHFADPRKVSTRDLNRLKQYVLNAESFIERQKMFRALEESNAVLERKVSERTAELSKALEREKELNELKSRFVSMASHEFRTPLSIVLSSTGLIEQYGGAVKNDRIQKHLDRIKSSVSNLTSILNDFLSLDKLEQGKVEVEADAFDIAAFMKDVVEDVETIRKKGQQIQISHEGDTDVILDQKKLRYILVNLLSNSIKYSSDEGSIELSSRVRQGVLVVAVRDNGIGIPEEEQRLLFNKFFRAQNTGNIQGTGLGLTIVKRYVELMKGRVEFSSNLNVGTTFTISIPKEITHEDGFSH